VRTKTPNKTTLWHVGYEYVDQVPVVYVSKKWMRCAVMKIRTITAKAAGRKFVRCNLGHMIASAGIESLNPFAPDYMKRPSDDDIARIAGKYVQRAKIVVAKEPA
jgi:hypothetical protein